MEKNNKITIAFDLDECLVWNQKNGRQTPRYDIIGILLTFQQLGCDIVVWSAGGTEYCGMAVERLGIHHMVRVIAKGSEKADITFDDQEVKLGKVNILVEK